MDLEEFTRYFLTTVQEITLHCGKEAAIETADWFFTNLVEKCGFKPPPQEMIDLIRTYIDDVRTISTQTSSGGNHGDDD